ncbi:MAG TPA: LamG domain-containing protein, partial [Conexibacter sp.]|nr:LamG domain-containing protein [Conexibacter sp.]
FRSVLTKAESYSLQFNGPVLELTIIQSGARHRLQTPAGVIVAGGTYHVVGTFDGTTQRLYVNGTQVASAPLSGSATITPRWLFVGSWDGSSEFFSGTIDEPAVYNAVLSPARVSTHYRAGTTG